MSASTPEQEAADPGAAAARLRTLAETHPTRSRVLERLATNPAAPLDLLLELAPLYPARVANNPSLMLHLLESPGGLREAKNRSLKALAAEPASPAWLLSALGALRHEEAQDPWLGAPLARNPSTPAEVLAGLCADFFGGIRSEASRHPRTPPEVVALLRQVGSSANLAERVEPVPEASEETLRRAAGLGYWGAHLAAFHPAATPELLLVLARHPDPDVVVAAVTSPRAPEAVLQRSGLVWGARPETLLLRVQEGAPREIPLSGAALGDGRSPGPRLKLLAQSPWFHRMLRDCSREDLTRLSRHLGAEVARAVVEHAPSLPPSLLGWLSSNLDSEVRLVIAARHDTPVRLLETLRRDPSYDVGARARATLQWRRGRPAPEPPEGSPLVAPAQRRRRIVRAREDEGDRYEGLGAAADRAARRGR